MFVVPGFRGRGIGRAVLRALEEEARRLGARRLVLETGTRQRSALGLYRDEGFAEIQPYGTYLAPTEAQYLATGLSVFLGKPLH